MVEFRILEKTPLTPRKSVVGGGSAAGKRGKRRTPFPENVPVCLCVFWALNSPTASRRPFVSHRLLLRPVPGRVLQRWLVILITSPDPPRQAREGFRGRLWRLCLSPPEPNDATQFGFDRPLPNSNTSRCHRVWTVSGGVGPGRPLFRPDPPTSRKSI